MFREMLIKGGIMVAGLIATQAVIEKFEKMNLKRKSNEDICESKEEGDNLEFDLRNPEDRKRAEDAIARAKDLASNEG